jgi:hypothetical protein
MTWQDYAIREGQQTIIELLNKKQSPSLHSTPRANEGLYSVRPSVVVVNKWTEYRKIFRYESNICADAYQQQQQQQQQQQRPPSR